MSNLRSHVSETLLEDIKTSLVEADAQEAEGESTPDTTRATELQDVFAEELGQYALTSEDVADLRAELREEIIYERVNRRKLQKQAELLGIGGWLSFFIIINMYVSPALNLLIIVASWITFSTYLMVMESGDPLFMMIVLSTLITVATVVWGVVAAWRLNGLRPRSVQFVKIYIVAAGISGIVTQLLLSEPTSSNAARLLQPLLWSAIWFTYFSVSKRVKATYPDADEPLIAVVS